MSVAELSRTWARLRRSAWDPQVYRSAAVSGTGNLVGYLAVLILIGTASITIQAQIAVTRLVSAFKTERLWERHLPEIRIMNGRASSPDPQPFVSKREGFVFILDTSGDTIDLDPTYRQGILVTRTDLVYRRERGLLETRRYPLDQLPNLLLNQATVERVLEVAVRWGWVVVGLGSLVWLWIAQPLQVLFWSLVGLVVNAFSKRSLRYAAIYKVGIIALTPPLCFDVVKRLAGWRGPGFWCLSLLLYVGYLVWGILVQPRPVETVPLRKSALEVP